MGAEGRLALGGATFGLDYGVSNARGRLEQREARRLLSAAWAAGVDMLDLAPAYGDAEEAAAAARPAEARFRVVSKTPRGASDAAEIVAAAHRSAALAPSGALDALLVHSVAEFRALGAAECWATLQRLKAEGVAARIGFSTYFDDDPAALADEFRPDVIQAPISLFDQRLVLDGSLARMAARGVEVHARSAYLQGLLFLAPDRLPPSLARIAGRLAEIQAAIDETGASRAAVALGYLLAQPEISRIVVGAASAAEFEQTVAEAGRAPKTLDWAALRLDDADALTPSTW